MSKLTIGVLAGAALASAAVLAPLVAGNGPTSDIALNAAAAASPTGSAGRLVAQATSTPKTTTTAKPTTAKVPVIVLPVPAPTKATPNPDPRSASCLKDPTIPYCASSSVRYLVKGSIATAHTQWLATLTKWGLAAVDDGCTDPGATATTFCVTRATHGSLKLTLLFKQTFDGQYSPKNVAVQTDAIHVKAMADAEKAKTVALKANILQAANAKIAALQAKADAWNAKNPQSSVIVAVSQ